MTNDTTQTASNSWLRLFIDRYFVHLTIATAVALASILDVPGGRPDTASLIASEFLQIVTLAISCIGVYELLKDRVGNFWLLHGATVLVANAVAVGLDFILDHYIFGLGQMTTELARQQAFSIGLLGREYLHDLKYPLVFWTASTVITMALQKRRAAMDAEIKESVSVNVQGFLRDLPPDWRGRIDLIEAQENYIVVHTDQGSKTILYRFKDAVSEMGSAIGLQVHRSFWVRRSAIQDFKKSQGRGTLTLMSGQSIPVSRSYLKLLEASLAER